MNTRQITAIMAPVLLLITMYPVFRGLARKFGIDRWRTAWFLGLVVYWLIWGLVFPWLIIGKDAILHIFQPGQLTGKILLLVLFPLVMSVIFKLVSKIEYQKPDTAAAIMVLFSCFGNGIFEELIWRGVYLELFPQSILFGILLPSVFFALWHYIPGSINPKGNVIGLMAGSGMMGLYLNILARHTHSIFWTMVIHILGSFITVL